MSHNLRITEQLVAKPVPAERATRHTIWYWLQLSCGIVSGILFIIFVIFGLLMLYATIY